MSPEVVQEYDTVSNQEGPSISKCAWLLTIHNVFSTLASLFNFAKLPFSMLCCNLDSRMHQHLSTLAKLASKRHLPNCCYIIMLVDAEQSLVHAVYI